MNSNHIISVLYHIWFLPSGLAYQWTALIEQVAERVCTVLEKESYFRYRNIWFYFMLKTALLWMDLNTQLQGGSNMTGTDLCVNKLHCAADVRPWESEATTSTLPPARVRTCSALSGSCQSDERTEGTTERGTTHCDQIPRRKRPVRWNSPQTPTTVWGRVSLMDPCVWVV